MSRVYTVPFVGLSVTNDSDQDIFELVNGTGVAAVVHGFELNSSLTSDERVSLRLVRRSTTGSGGTGATEVPLEVGDSTPAVAISTLVTTPGTIGAILQGWQWSQLAPLIYIPPPESRPKLPPSGRLCLNLQTAVAATRTWSGSVTWEEIG